MSAKWSVLEVVREHYATLVDLGTGRRRPGDFASILLAPAALAAVVLLAGVQLRGSAELLAGVGIYTAGLFAVLLQVFPLRQRLVDDPRLAGQTRLGRLVDEVEVNVSYAVLVGLAVTAMLMAVSALYGEPLPSWSSGLLTFGFGHLLMVSLMVLKRIRAVYRRMRT